MKRLIVLLLLMVLATPALAHNHRTPGGERELPPTIPTPTRFDGFTILSHADQDGCTQENPDPPAWCTGEIVLWHAPYLTTTPYLGNSGWLPGDRSGYGCAYMFLQSGGQLIGRVTFAAVKPPRTQEPQPGFYAIVKDDGMAEGERFFGGQLAPEGSNELGDCPGTSVAYESAPTAADQRPRLGYWLGRDLVEIRDYTTTQAHPDLVFQVLEVINQPFQVTVPSGTYTVRQRVTVASYLNGVPQVIVYYDAIGNGSLSIDL